jgi:hypothetical protein
LGEQLTVHIPTYTKAHQASKTLATTRLSYSLGP